MTPSLNEQLVDDEPVIYCLEGIWRDSSSRDRRTWDWSVKPMLDLLSQNRVWEHRYRNCATVHELEFYIQNEWIDCLEGSVLYISTHAKPGRLYLHDEVGLELTGGRSGQLSLGEMLEGMCDNCVVHFGGCELMNVDDEVISDFIAQTGAAVVSGFKADVSWFSGAMPGALAELSYFHELSPWVNERDTHQFSDGALVQQTMRNISAQMQRRFDDCHFHYLTWCDTSGVEDQVERLVVNGS